MVSTHDARLVPIADKIVKMVPDSVDVEHPTRTVEFAAGQSVFEQGDSSDVVYVVESGEVDIVRVLADGWEELLNRVGPGQYFGELGPFLGFPRSASARAHTDVVLTAYAARVFRERVPAPRLNTAGRLRSPRRDCRVAYCLRRAVSARLGPALLAAAAGLDRAPRPPPSMPSSSAATISTSAGTSNSGRRS